MYGLENPLSEVHMKPLFIDGGFYPSVLHFVYYRVLCGEMRRAKNFPPSFQRKWAEKILAADSMRALQRAYRELLQHFRKRTGAAEMDRHAAAEKDRHDGRGVEFAIESALPDLLLTGFRAKFDQYDDAYNALLDTADAVLISW